MVRFKLQPQKNLSSTVYTFIIHIHIRIVSLSLSFDGKKSMHKITHGSILWACVLMCLVKWNYLSRISINFPFFYHFDIYSFSYSNRFLSFFFFFFILLKRIIKKKCRRQPTKEEEKIVFLCVSNNKIKSFKGRKKKLV